jgi:hypothetical protein
MPPLASSNGEKAKARLSSNSSSREHSPSNDSSCRDRVRADALDAAASPHVEQQQLVEQPADAQRIKQQQQEQPAAAQDNLELLCTTQQTADSALVAAEKQTGLPRQSRSVSSLWPVYADAEASSSSASVSTIGTLPARSELCSSASSNSIQACGDGQSGNTPGAGKAERTDAGQGDFSSTSGGNGSGGGPDRGTDNSSGHGGGEHSSGGGGGNSGNSGGDDDRPGDDGHNHPVCTSPPSDDTTATATALSTSSDSIVLSPMAGISAAQSAAGEASVSLGCSASDPVIVPRPSPLGALPGLMLRGSPASLGGAAAAGAGLGAPGTPSAAAGVSNSPGFSFPTNLASLNIGGSSSAGPAASSSYTPGSLVDVLLSPSAFGARGHLGQGAAAGGQGFGPFGGPNSTGRRASDVGTLGAGPSLLGSWGSGLNPQHSSQGQPGIVPVGSWPSAAPGLGALEEHMQGQQRQHQQPAALPPGAARGANSDPALERRALSGYLHLLHPGLMGLIGSTDTAGSLGPVSGSNHLMSWLTEPASGLSSAGSGPTGAPIRPASAAAMASQRADAGQGAAGGAAAAQTGSSLTAGSLTPQGSTGMPTSGGNSSGGDVAQDVGPQRDQRPPLGGPVGSGGAPLRKPSVPGAAAKVLSGPAGPGAAEGQQGTAAAGGQVALATAGSGSISSSGSFAGSSFGGIAHSYSGESLEDLESMRMSSASFAAALAEAEAIAAGVAAHMAAAQQAGQGQVAGASGAKVDGSSAPTDRCARGQLTSADCLAVTHCALTPCRLTCALVAHSWSPADVADTLPWQETVWLAQCLTCAVLCCAVLSVLQFAW